MRLWSLHPSTLDRAALVACWREGLLAQRVLTGATRGYTRHPQLERFHAQPDPLAAIGAYLAAVADAAQARGYRFDRGRIDRPAGRVQRIRVTEGQLAFELAHLRAKLIVRTPLAALPDRPEPHPLFVVEPGPIAAWERP